MPRPIILRQNPRPTGPSIRNLDGSVHPRTIEALRETSQRLQQAGIRHALIGGLAVGVHGWPRGTKDIDLLLGREGYQETPSGIVVLEPRAHAAAAASPVVVDMLVPDRGEDFLDKALDDALISEGIPVIPLEALFYTKLKANRPRDRLDLSELVAYGIPVSKVREYLTKNAPSMLDRFEEIVRSTTA